MQTGKACLRLMLDQGMVDSGSVCDPKGRAQYMHSNTALAPTEREYFRCMINLRHFHMPNYVGVLVIWPWIAGF